MDEDTIKAVGATSFIGEVTVSPLEISSAGADNLSCLQPALTLLATCSLFRVSSDESFLQSASLLKSFILAMVLHPIVQKRAQAEIDLVIGETRLPTWADRESLPYVEALCREMLRWHPVLPLVEKLISI